MSGRLYLITGGSGSGKSAFAERFLLAQCTGRAVYLAAMAAGEDPESQRRIARHRAMRARHGAEAGREFLTVERPLDIGGAAVGPGDWALLEDLGNLLANEIWAPGGAGPDRAEAAVLAGLEALLDRVEGLVVVSNEIFSDGGDYDPETLAYAAALARLHRALAPRASGSCRVVCGIPVWDGGCGIHPFS